MVPVLAIARELAGELRGYERRPDVHVIVVAPRSLELAAEVAQQLRVPFDLFPVRALHNPVRASHDPARASHDDQTSGLPVGIVGSGGVLVIDQAAMATQRCSPSALAELAQTTARALVDFEREIRGGAEPPDLRHRTIILLDDGWTSIRILQMTIAALRRYWVKGTTLAIPTITESDLALVRAEADAIVSAVVPDGSPPVEAPHAQAPTSVAEIQRLLRAASPPGVAREQPSATIRLAQPLATSPLGVSVEA